MNPIRSRRFLIPAMVLAGLASLRAPAAQVAIPAASVAATPSDSPDDARAWRPGALGLEVALRPLAGGIVLLVRADPALTRLHVVRAPANAPLSASALAQQDSALAVINGSFFDAAGQPIGWIVSRGTILAPPARRGWGAFAVAQGRPRIVSMEDAGAPADEALQAGPRLVIDGKPNAGLKPQSARRAFIGIDASGRVVLGSTGPTPVSATDLAAFLARPEREDGAGLVNALNLDGGSSAQLYVRDSGGGAMDFSGIPVPVLIEILPRTER